MGKGVHVIEIEDVCTEASANNSNDSNSGNVSSLGCKSRLLRFGYCINLIIKLFSWAVNYDGFGAALIKTIPALMMATCIGSPLILYGFILLPTALRVGSPVCYVLYVFWWAFITLVEVFAAVIGYLYDSVAQ